MGVVKHSLEWEEDCLHYHGKILMGSKAHWCPDWDDLPVDETVGEFEYCDCFSGDSNGTSKDASW